jgi:hypothetical protein
MARSPSDDACQSALTPVGQEVAIFSPGVPESWAWNFGGNESLEKAATLHWKLEYWGGAIQEGELDLIEANRKSLVFTFFPDKQGWALLETVLLTKDNQVLARDETSLSIGTTPEHGQRNFHYGMSTHPMRALEKNYPLELDLLQALGIDILRQDLEWTALEPAQGSWSLQKLDRTVDDLDSRGIETQAILLPTAQWATTGNPRAKDWADWAYKMPRLEPWLEYVHTLVQRYGDRIHYWEVWNEPDGYNFWRDTPENYVKLFDQTSQAIKLADPKAQVLNGGLSLLTEGDGQVFRNNFIAMASRDDWSILAYHDYMTFDEMIARYPTARNIFKEPKLDKLPFWINEGGFHTLVPDGEHRQAVELVKKMAAAPSLARVEGYFWYRLNDIYIPAKDPEGRFGVVDYFYRPRPAFTAYQNLIRELAPRRYFAPNSVDKNDKDPGLWIFAYADLKTYDHRLVVWRKAEGTSQPFLFSWPAQSGHITGAKDLMGNSLKVYDVGTFQAVALSAEPIFISFKGQPSYPQIQPLLKLPSILTILPEGETSLKVSLENPLDKASSVTIVGSLQSSPHIKLFDEEKTLAPLENAEISISCYIPLQPGKTDSLNLQVHFPEATEPLEARIPLETACVIPRINTPGQDLPAWHVTLDQAQNVVNLYDGMDQPRFAWKGSADLSVTAGMNYDDKALYFKITVQDDFHWQQGHLGELWKGDSLQVAFKMKEEDVTPLEFAVALDNEGKQVSWVSSVPASSDVTMGPLPADAPFSVTRTGAITRYQMVLPWSHLGLTGIPKDVFRFSFLVNDNDKEGGRKQWIELSPGIGKNKNAQLFPLFMCR